MSRGLLHHLVISVSEVPRSIQFYGPVLTHLGYEPAGSSHRYADWKRWELETPHEISIVQAEPNLASVKHRKGAVGHHHHLAFSAISRADVDSFHKEVLLSLAAKGLCTIDDPPVDCPEYGDGYYATFFRDPDGLQFEFVINPNFAKAQCQRNQAKTVGRVNDE